MAENTLFINGSMHAASTSPAGTRKLYVSPAIVHEQRLETRAGTPLGAPDNLDPFAAPPSEAH